MRPDADRFVISCFVCEKKRPVLQSIRCSGAADCILNDTATTEIYTLSLHDALDGRRIIRSEEHTSELQSHDNLVCRLLLEKKESCDSSSTQTPSCGNGQIGIKAIIRTSDPRMTGGCQDPRVVFKSAATPADSPFSPTRAVPG